MPLQPQHQGSKVLAQHEAKMAFNNSQDPHPKQENVDPNSQKRANEANLRPSKVQSFFLRTSQIQGNNSGNRPTEETEMPDCPLELKDDIFGLRQNNDRVELLPRATPQFKISSYSQPAACVPVNSKQKKSIALGLESQQNLVSDRYIPIRGDKMESELQDLLMDISLDESGAKKLEVPLTQPQVIKPSEFKTFLASQLIQPHPPRSMSQSKKQQPVYHRTLSQTSMQGIQLQKSLQQLPQHEKSGVLPGKILSFKKRSFIDTSQDEDGHLIHQDKAFQDQLMATKKCFSQPSEDSSSASQIFFRPRLRATALPEVPLKIFEAPDLRCDPSLNLLDWGPQCNPFTPSSRLAVALADQVFLIDHDTGRNSIVASITQQDDIKRYIASINFDRSGEALALGTSDRQLQIYDVERSRQIRRMSSMFGGRVTSVSWNRSVLAPYLVSAAGVDSLIVNHDIRMKNSIVNFIKQHPTGADIIQLQWSPNQSHEQMRLSDPSSIYLASTSNACDLGVWRLTDLQYATRQQFQDPSQDSPAPFLYESEIFGAPVKSLAWNPTHDGMLAVGGGQGDQIIRVYDFSKGSKDVLHTIKCNNPVQSLQWRKNPLKQSSDFTLGFCEELISSHGMPDCEIKLWQVNKYQPTTPEGQDFRFWFTKVRDWTSHTGPILSSALSPDGSLVCTLGADETLRVWNVFERAEQPTGNASQKKQILEKQDSKLIEKSLKKHQLSIWQAKRTIHSGVDLNEEAEREGLEQYISSQKSTIR
ncbi:hypothetical protein FGO68_gene5618 [Halteria grandinella]|uniref:Uncharacterized protein n=1 Tax=Halteria grandinella TaxID=5974 RepID=A0A8J8NXH9_HALGN|nr:hypothetical protein FGO68_gene5618 [Halteria grandinella]